MIMLDDDDFKVFNSTLNTSKESCDQIVVLLLNSKLQ